MDLLQSKLTFIKDLHFQYESCVQSVQFIRDKYGLMIDSIKSEIGRRLQQKDTFITKTGVQLMDLIIQQYRTINKQIQQSFLQSNKMHLYLYEQQQALNETICHARPLLRSMQGLSEFTSEKTLKNASLKTAISKQEQMIRQNRQLKAQAYDNNQQMDIKQTNKRNYRTEGEKQRRYRLNLMLIDKIGNQGLLQVGQKIWKAQTEELNYLMDECVTSAADLSELKFKVGLKSKTKTFNNSDNHTPLKNSKPFDSVQRYKSLGIESSLGQKDHLENMEINLMCEQDMTEMAISNSNSLTFGDLQRITERDQHLQSDEFSPLHKLRQSAACAI